MVFGKMDGSVVFIVSAALYLRVWMVGVDSMVLLILKMFDMILVVMFVTSVRRSRYGSVFMFVWFVSRLVCLVCSWCGMLAWIGSGCGCRGRARGVRGWWCHVNLGC